MADNWRMLDFTMFHGELRFNKNTRRLQAVDHKTGEVTEHSLRDINIVFIGLNVQLAPAMMYHFAKQDVVVLFCDWKGLPACSMYPWIDAHGRVAARQRAQASLSAPRSKNAWMRIVKAKIKGQANNLKVLGVPNAARLNELSRQVRTGDPSNVEGLAARIYWSSIFSGESFSRVPGEGAEGRNSLLDYGYTLMRGHSMRAVLSAGLTPALGMYHRSRSNLFALADDLIESFRPVVDFAVAGLEAGACLEDRDVKRALMQATLAPFGVNGLSTPATMTDFAQQYGRYVEGEVDHLAVPVWNPRKEGNANEIEKV